MQRGQAQRAGLGGKAEMTDVRGVHMGPVFRTRSGSKTRRLLRHLGGPSWLAKSKAFEAQLFLFMLGICYKYYNRFPLCKCIQHRLFLKQTLFKK